MEMEESTRVVSLADVERIREQERAMAAASSAPAPEPAPASANPWEDEPTRAAPARPAAAPWFVMVKSKQEGPLDEAGLQGLMESGVINARSFFWQQGMADWKRGSDIPELANLFAPPPEPPPPELPPEPATVAVRGQGHDAPAQQQDDNAWDDVPTTVGQAPAAREPWDLDPPAAGQPQPQQRQAQRQQAQPQARWEEPPQEDQPAWDDGQQQQAQGQDDQQQWDDQQAQGQDDQQQQWDDQPAQDPGQEDQPAWDEPAPEQPRAQKQARSNGSGSKAGVGDDLFSDLDLPDKNEPPPDSESPLVATGENTDPLASVRGSKPDGKKPVEDTRYFMKKSGVTRRNPAWKVALFIMLPILLIVGGAFALDTLNVVPKVKVVDAQGKTVEKSWLFSGEGRSELKDRLLGKKTPAPVPTPAPAPTPAPTDKKPAQAPTPKPEGGAAEEKPETGKSAEELQQLLGDGSKADVAPTVRKDTEVAAKDAAGTGGPAQEDVMKVVEKAQGGFQGCVETELRKNPKFKGGKVTLVTTVGTSGVVKDSKLDRKELDAAPVGDCIKKNAKRMVFPKFTLDDGTEEIELQIPLVLTSGAM